MRKVHTINTPHINFLALETLQLHYSPFLQFLAIMAPEPSVIEAEVDFHVPAAGKPCKTWYTIFGDLKSGKRPLVCLHGGPGVPHPYLLPMRYIASSHGIPVVMYDQLGCGKSTHLKEKAGDGAFWTVDLFLSELDNLLRHLGIQDDYDLLGQSWGGMLGACHAIRQPKGLHKLVIADSPASMELWVQTAEKLRLQLPKEINEKLLQHEKDGTTESEEYEETMKFYYDKHVCRVKPTPVELARSEAFLKEDNTVFMTM
jgi:proline-specific peptidase